MSRILIVDDDYDILRYCDAALAQHGHEVVLASNPQRAISILQSHPVDLLVMDIVMPMLNGFDFLKTLKQLPNFHAPVLMLTGRTTANDVMKALQLGATDYMCKPMDRDIFLAKVESLLIRADQNGVYADAPEIRFAHSSTHSKAELVLPALVTKVSEMGLTILSASYVDRNLRVKVESSIFREIGIHCPPLRAASCKPLQNDPEYRYEVFVSFVGLDEMAMRKVRRWILTHQISKRKVA